MIDRESRIAAALATLGEWKVLADDRDRLVVFAHDEGATQIAIANKSGLARNTVKKIIDSARRQAPAPAADGDPLTQWHHPNLASATDGRYRFHPFTGAETAPRERIDWAAARQKLTGEQFGRLEGEYAAAQDLWRKARYRRQLRPLLESAAKTWTTWRQAKAHLDASYAAFDDLDDNRWRSNLLRWGDARTAAVAAAKKWDGIAESMTRLATSYAERAGEAWSADDNPRRVACEFGVDSSQWTITDVDDDRHGSHHTLEHQLDMIIQQQQDRLATVTDRLTGCPGSTITD